MLRVLITATVLAASLVNGDVISCLADLKVPQDIPGTASFKADSLPYNLRLPFTPKAYTLPTTTKHIQDALLCANKYSFKVNPRSGGHSYAAHSIGGENGHLVIDLKYFNDIKVDPKTNIASIGAGARLGNVALELFSQGERALPHGVCPGVGVGGHVTVGGWGYLSRTEGLLLDFLLEATVVLADGSVVTASETKNPELFWGLRGAGCSFGVATNFKFRTVPAPPSNILFFYAYNWTTTEMIQGFEAFQAYGGSDDIPREMNIRALTSLLLGSLIWVVEGVYHGSPTDFERAIAPLLPKLGTPVLVINETLGWLDALTYANNNEPLLAAIGADTGSLEQLAKPVNYTVHQNFFNKSLMSPALSSVAVASMVNWLENTAKNLTSRSWFIIFLIIGGPSSAVRAVPNTATAYAHRESLLSYEFSDLVANNETYSDSFFSFLDSGIASITDAMPGTVFGNYYGYADPTLSLKQAHKGYWGTNYARLAALKRKVDPRNLFENPQSVGEE